MNRQGAELRGDVDMIANRIIPMDVNYNGITDELLQDYLITVEMWLTDNCQHGWFIKTLKDEVFKFPTKVEIGFESDEDAVLFKCGSLWKQVIGK